MREWFRRGPREPRQEPAADGQTGAEVTARPIPENLWTRCPSCKELNYSREFEKCLKVCQKCGYHAPLSARERVALLADPESFVEYDTGMTSGDPLGFQRPDKTYAQGLREYQERTGEREACIYGTATITGVPVVLCVFEFRFISGTMGSVVGEKVARAVELAVKLRRPLITVVASGGARMDEGLLSLMQMAKTAAAVARLHAAGVLYISIMCDPTLGGTTASFASLADVIIAEPGADIGFAGRRPIEQIMRQKLPAKARRAETALERGMIDLVVPRAELRDTVSRLLLVYWVSNPAAAQPRRLEPVVALR